MVELDVRTTWIYHHSRDEILRYHSSYDGHSALFSRVGDAAHQQQNRTFHPTRLFVINVYRLDQGIFVLTSFSNACSRFYVSDPQEREKPWQLQTSCQEICPRNIFQSSSRSRPKLRLIKPRISLTENWIKGMTRILTGWTDQKHISHQILIFVRADSHWTFACKTSPAVFDLARCLM